MNPISFCAWVSCSKHWRFAALFSLTVLLLAGYPDFSFVNKPAGVSKCTLTLQIFIVGGVSKVREHFSENRTIGVGVYPALRPLSAPPLCAPSRSAFCFVAWGDAVALPGQAQGRASTETPPPPVNDQAGQAILHPLGIGLALLFIILMVSLFRWMFNVPPQLPYAVVKARQSVSALHRILVPITTQLASERAVELACRLGETQKAEIILAYVVEVPFTLPLNAAMPIEQIKGQEALHTAQFIVEQHNLPARTRLVPDRYTWGGILQLARSERVDAIVMSVGTERPGLTDGLGRTTQEILKRAECEVILDRAPDGRGR